MIIQEELSASLDEPAECVVMHRVEPTRLQTLALQLTEKLNHLAENVEQIMDPRSGGKRFTLIFFVDRSNLFFHFQGKVLRIVKIGVDGIKIKINKSKMSTEEAVEDVEGDRIMVNDLDMLIVSVGFTNN